MNETELTTYASDLNNRGSIFYLPEGWATPLATGHKYRFFFASMDAATRMNTFGTAMNAPNIDWEFLEMSITADYVKTD